MEWMFCIETEFAISGDTLGRSLISYFGMNLLFPPFDKRFNLNTKYHYHHIYLQAQG